MRQNILLLASAVLSTSLYAQTKPNIVLILADDMRGSAMNFLGEESVITPNLDSFSKDAVTFTNAHIMGGTSGAVSMPSRAMLFSGKYLHTLQNQGSEIPADHTTLGEVLRDNGYNTYHTGKWHNGTTGFNRCFEDAKAVYFGGMFDHWNVPLHDYHSDGKYENSRPVAVEPRKSNELRYEQGDYVMSGRHAVDIFTNTAVDYIESKDSNSKPFFLSVSYMSPHDPRTTYQKYFDMYDTESMDLPLNFMESHPFDNGELNIRDENTLPRPRVAEQVKGAIRDYYGLITHLDEGVGKILETLKSNGIYDNTIIIFAADNGLACGQHGLMGKQNMYEHSVRVPLMIKDVENGSKNIKREQLCYLIDIFPTVCEKVGVEVPNSVDGVSLSPILDNNLPIRDYLYYGYVEKQRALSDGQWKLIEYIVGGERRTQLFNLKDDPFEISDLSNDKKYSEKIAQMRKIMKKEALTTKDEIEFVKEF